MTTITIRQRGIKVKDLILSSRQKVTTASFGLVDQITSKEIVEFSNNRSSIFSSYSNNKIRMENEDREGSGDFDDIDLPLGTRVDLPPSKVSRDLLFKFNRNIVETTNLKGFVADSLKNLLEDVNYRQTTYSNGSSLIVDNLAFSVFLYPKTLNRWVNLTKYLFDVDTNMSDTGGNFSFNLMPVRGVFNSEWEIDEDVASKNNVYSRNVNDKDYFKNLISQNDLVLIRLSRLESERDVEATNPNSETVSSEQPSLIYDMIGLVDTVEEGRSFSGNEASISITGRDLIKTLIDDGAYFFYGQVGETPFVNEPDGSTARRTRLSFSSNSLFSYAFKTIEDTIQFIISKYSTTGLVANEAFTQWGNRRSAKLNLNEETGEVLAELEPMEGVWSLIEFAFDESAKNRLLTDNSIAREQGSVLNAIEKIVQKPFVEFYGDTYGDKYVFSIRKPPTDKLGTISWVYGDVATNLRTDLTNTTIKKVDFRAPVRGSVERNVFNIQRTLSDYVVDIDKSQIIDENFVFAQESYSWYRLTPKYRGDSVTDLSQYPPVAFSEFTDRFGAKSYSQEIYYVNYNPGPVSDSGTVLAETNLQKQFIEDLRYLIESNACIPFTREGVLTIHLNRTIKRGTFIYHKPNNEIFYVDGVSHRTNISNSQIDGVTTLTLKRGMVEPYIRGQNGISYFDIIDFGDPTGARDARTILSSWRVNPEVFNFFLERRQFA